MAKILKICWGPWENASRDKRELSVYRELGNDVLVLAEGNLDDRGRNDIVETFSVKRYSSKPFGLNAPKRINQLSSLFTWARYARKLNPDIISGHDYIGWTIGRMSTFLKKKKPIFIYDSHEFELGRNVQRNKIRHSIIRRIERYILNNSAFSIMVNDNIADEVKRIYGLKNKPVVVRSTPNYWEIDHNKCIDRRRFIKQEFERNGNKMDNPFYVMYHGAIMNGRGIETLIRLTSINPHINSVILGNGDARYIESLKALVKECGVEDRVLFHPAVPISELWKYVGAVDLSFMMIEGKVKSYYFALPNKFFESIQSLTPIVASDFPEMKRLIDEYHIGLTCNPDDLEAINGCIERMRLDKALYSNCKKNLEIAKKELCWENEKKVLEDAFRQFCDGVN